MTREEILLNSIWTSGKLTVFSPFFEQEVRLELFTSEYNLKNTHQIISEQFVQCINDFLALSEVNKPLLKSLLYQHCQECCADISYGFEVQQGETETEANLRNFQISDAQTAFEKSNLDHVVIAEDKLRKNRFVKIVFYPDWEAEHGCELILKNGKLLNYYGESSTYLGQFDD